MDDMNAPWRRPTRRDSEALRATTRGAAAHLPFLLAPELDDANWPHRRLWDVRSALDLGEGLMGAELLELSREMDRILVTRNSVYLDDGRYLPEHCPGVIVIGACWQERLDEVLTTIAGLLGPVPALYRHVKVDATNAGELIVCALEGRGRRMRRHYLVDGDGLPWLTDLAEVEEHAAAVH